MHHATEPTPRDRCRYCCDRIDPRNYERAGRGFACLPCVDEFARSTPHTESTEQE